MGRLLPQALYSNELIDLHRERVQKAELSLEGSDEEPASIEANYDDWARVAKRAKLFDPDGQRSYAMLKKMQLAELGRLTQVDPHGVWSLTLAQKIASGV